MGTGRDFRDCKVVDPTSVLPLLLREQVRILPVSGRGPDICSSSSLSLARLEIGGPNVYEPQDTLPSSSSLSLSRLEIRGHSFFFFITLKHRVEWYKSL